jgi:hypothetical protein
MAMSAGRLAEEHAGVVDRWRDLLKVIWVDAGPDSAEVVKVQPIDEDAAMQCEAVPVSTVIVCVDHELPVPSRFEAGGP